MIRAGGLRHFGRGCAISSRGGSSGQFAASQYCRHPRGGRARGPALLFHGPGRWPRPRRDGAADGPIGRQRAARYLKTIAEAIHFAHQRGTLHRDLKPQNVLIDAADRPRITDFGLAKTSGDSQLTQSGIIMGSPSYMPPEQAAGRQGEIGPASDVYSLGAMLYELLTGRPPFRGDSTMATLRDVMETEPTALRKLKAEIPPDLETICLKCLEKSPAARYPTALALGRRTGPLPQGRADSGPAGRRGPQSGELGPASSRHVGGRGGAGHRRASIRRVLSVGRKRIPTGETGKSRFGADPRTASRSRRYLERDQHLRFPCRRVREFLCSPACDGPAD